MSRKEQLKQLLKIKESKVDITPKPVSTFSTSVIMPHEKDAELGRRIIQKKIMAKAQ